MAKITEFWNHTMAHASTGHILDVGGTPTMALVTLALFLVILWVSWVFCCGGILCLLLGYFSSSMVLFLTFACQAE